MHIVAPLSRAYLSLPKQGVGNEEVWSVADTRSPTEVKAEYVDMTVVPMATDKIINLVGIWPCFARHYGSVTFR